MMYNYDSHFTDDKKRSIENLNNLIKVAQLMTGRASTGIKANSLQIPEILTVRFILNYQIDNTFIKLRETRIYIIHF